MKILKVGGTALVITVTVLTLITGGKPTKAQILNDVPIILPSVVAILCVLKFHKA